MLSVIAVRQSARLSSFFRTLHGNSRVKIFSHPLPIAWEYHVRTVLWRVHHGVGGRIVGEERDPREKKTYFFCVDQRTGRGLWERLALDEPWWGGITFVERDTVFPHGCASPDLPV